MAYLLHVLSEIKKLNI